MAEIIKLPTHVDDRGSLTVIEKILPFDIKRIFYIYGVDDSVRGNHRYRRTIQYAVCIKGSCIISNDTGVKKQEFIMDSPGKGLLLYPEDYHSMHHFTEDAILLVLASEYFDPNDYIYESYD